jgi:hypothetical protein
MKCLVLGLVLFSTCTLADVSNEVFLRGKVGGSFTDTEVRVVDHLGQSMTLPRSAFPKDFVLRQGAEFALEIDPALIKDVKVPKKKH